MTVAMPAPIPREVRRLFVFFSIAYFAQGISQDKSGMLNQVLRNFYRKHEHMDATAIADFSAPLMLPWVIKPVYGLISDFFPLGRYRRKSYLVLTSLLAVLGFVLILFTEGRHLLRAALFLTSLGIAFGDVLVDALMVENGQRTGYLRLFQGCQWQWISIAGIAAALLGGQFSQRFDPVLALRIAAIIAAIPMLVLCLAGLRMVHEEHAHDSRAEARSTVAGFREALRSRTLWKMVAILFLFGFAPNAGTAWYVYQTEKLKFPQEFIGYADAAGNAGLVAGAWLFNRVFALGFTQRRLLAGALVAAAAGTLLYLLVRDRPTAIAVAVVGGTLAMIAQLSMLSLAGEACPKRAEGFTFAALMGILNQATQWGDQIGSRIFDACHQHIWQLILISAGTTLLALVLVPLLPSTPPAAPLDESLDPEVP